jgi:hypothetical protein
MQHIFNFSTLNIVSLRLKHYRWAKKNCRQINKVAFCPIFFPL